MANILLGQAFAGEKMTQMPSAFGAGYFRAYAVGVQAFMHRAGNLFVKARPPASRLKLHLGIVKRSPALPADVNTGLLVIDILPRKRRFRALVYDYAFFGRG